MTPSPTPVPLCSPLPPRGRGAGGGGGLSQLADLYTSDDLFGELSEVIKPKPSKSPAEDDDEIAARWSVWLDQQKDLHSYRDIFCISCGNVKHIPIYCHNRFCPVCSAGRKFKVQGKLEALLAKFPPTARRRLKMLTLTQPKQIDLKEGLKKLLSSFKRLRNRKKWKEWNCDGGYVVEIKGTENNWHIHLHAIITSYYIPEPELWAEWEACGGGKHAHLMAIPNATAIAYVTKYITKGEFDPDYVAQINSALRDQRLFSTFGKWHNAKTPKVKLECRCKVCGGTQWHAFDNFFYGCDSRYIEHYLAQLRYNFEHPNEGLS